MVTQTAFIISFALFRSCETMHVNSQMRSSEMNVPTNTEAHSFDGKWVGETLHVVESFIEKRVWICSMMTHLVDAILIENRSKLCFSIQIRSTNMRYVYFNPKPETTHICFTFLFILFVEKRISEEVDLNCKPFFYLCLVLVCDHFHLNQLRRFLGIKSKRFHSKKNIQSSRQNDFTMCVSSHKRFDCKPNVLVKIEFD